MFKFFQSRLPAEEALLLANANLKSAHITQDRKKAEKYCTVAEKKLGRIKDPKNSTHLNEIIAAYRELGGLLDKLVLRDKAKGIHKKAEK